MRSVVTAALGLVLAASAVSAQTAESGVIADLVSASHILADQGVVDGFGHVSVRHPSNPNHFLMSRSMAPSLVTRDDIMEFDLDGNAIDGQGRQSSSSASSTRKSTRPGLTCSPSCTATHPP